MQIWSKQIEHAYSLRLPPDLKDWFDQALWKNPIGAEFCFPLHPDRILNPTHQEIWAGFMPADLLPVIGNNYGDWLCLRAGPEDHVTEVVRWSHIGGDWMPYGETISQALLFDAALRVAGIGNAEMPTTHLPNEQQWAAAVWANGQLPRPLPKFWESESDAQNEPATCPFEFLLKHELCITAASCERALAALANPMRRKASPKLALELGVQWNSDFVRWLFDAATLPGEIAKALEDAWGQDASVFAKQDWNQAEKHAKRVLEQRDDIAWAANVAGWAAERKGDKLEAIRRYERGLHASAFTDDAVRFRTEWSPESFAKFAAFRIHELSASENTSPLSNEYVQLFAGPPSQLKQRVAGFWTNAAESAATANPYPLLWRAGWDIGMTELADYEPLLAKLESAAAAGGDHARAAIAAAHRNVF